MRLMKQMVRGLVVVSLLAALTAGPGARSAAVAEFTYGQEVSVNADFLNLRSGSSLDSAVIDVLPYGTTGIISAGPFFADGYDWYYLNVGSQQGWVAGGFLSANTGNGGGWPVGTTLEVASGPLNLRCCHGIGTTIEGTLAVV